MSTRPLRYVLFALVLALGALAVPADAAKSATLTIKAARSGYVEQAFPSGVTLRAELSTVASSGSYAGFYLQPLSRPAQDGWGRVWFKQFAHKDFRPVGVSLGQPAWSDWRVPAGRYRIHVFGDAAMVARLTFAGRVASRTLTPKAASRAAAVSKDVTPAVAGERVPTSAAVVADLPIAVHTNSLSFAATFTVYRGTWVVDPSQRDGCIGDSGGLPCTALSRNGGRENHWQHQIVGPLTYAVAMSSSSYNPHGLSSGEKTAWFHVETPHLTERVAVAAFTLGF